VEGCEYDIEIVNDTKPENPLSGKYIVRIVGEGGVPIDFTKFEQKVDGTYAIENNQTGDSLYILETEIPINKREGKLVPPAENFRHFTLDKRTLETIEKVATAVELKQPCLLEGETSTSKTSSIEYLAMRSNNQVVRLNMNGQTDTSELVGKFVPNDGQLQIEFEQLLSKPDLLNKQSLEMLQNIVKDGRSLSLLESQKIAEIEGIKIPEWRWQDGLVSEAMKKGYWIILDEINLGEPQILERLNSVLEKNASIILSENGGTRIGPNGDFETHEDFRIFATMNPAEYAGRNPMSPAYKDRWTSYKFVEIPSETEYADMMKLMVYGEQPDVEIGGKKYAGEKVEPLFNKSSEVPNFRSFISKVAKFQSSLEKLARERVIGKGRKEKYVFTRRGLIEFLTYIETKTIVINRQTGQRKDILSDPKEVVLRAIKHCFLDKISNEEDFKKVNTQLSAIGIAESNWTHIF
jgi:MoxR-like ATPase